MRIQSLHRKPQVLFITLLMTMLSIQPMLAQDGFDDDVDDEPAVPIDGSYIVLGLIAGAFFGIKKLKVGQLLHK